MKKILIVANVAKEHILKFHIPTIKMLKENGWIVHVACSGEEEIPYCDKKWIMQYKRNPFSINTVIGIKLLKKIIDQEKYDIIHCHTPTGGIVARIASIITIREKRAKVIYTAHGYHFYKGAPIINWILFFPIEWLLSFFTDCIITINQEDYDNTLKYHFRMKRLEKVNGIGVDLDRFNLLNQKEVKSTYREKLHLPQDALVLVYVAELIPNKNQAFLLKVLQKVLLTNKNTYLILVGPDHNKGSYHKLAIELGLDKKVMFLGWRSDIPQLLSCSDIYVASSVREGLGLNLIEAMAAGIPVIASKNRGHSEVIKDNYNGYLVEQDDVDAMVNRIILLKNDKEDVNRIVVNAKLDIHRFESLEVLKEFQTIYETL